ANPNPRVGGEDELPGKVNYLLGSEPNHWLRRIQTFGKVKFLGIYPGIDLVYYGHGHRLEHDFIVKPGADPEAIALKFEGADGMEIASDGALVVKKGPRHVTFGKPLIYQQLAGVWKRIDGGYVLKARNQIAFQVAAYDAGSPLVIDPVLNFSTYLGGS